MCGKDVSQERTFGTVWDVCIPFRLPGFECLFTFWQKAAGDVPVSLPLGGKPGLILDPSFGLVEPWLTDAFRRNEPPHGRSLSVCLSVCLSNKQ